MPGGGVAGGPEKCDYVIKDLGFDACVDHKQGDLKAALAAVCLRGIDVYFDNVGGAVLKAVLRLINQNARIPLCGTIADYNAHELPPGLNLRPLLVKRALIKGFIITDHGDRAPASKSVRPGSETASCATARTSSRGSSRRRRRSWGCSRKELLEAGACRAGPHEALKEPRSGRKSINISQMPIAPRCALVLAFVLACARLSAAQGDPSWTEPFEPFRIAGNLYYVGTRVCRRSCS